MAEALVKVVTGQITKMKYLVEMKTPDVPFERILEICFRLYMCIRLGLSVLGLFSFFIVIEIQSLHLVINNMHNLLCK